MSKNIRRWVAHALAAGVVIAGIVVGTGMSTSGAVAAPAVPTPAPATATGDGGIWIGP